jgi:hypothetical protein
VSPERDGPSDGTPSFGRAPIPAPEHPGVFARGTVPGEVLKFLEQPHAQSMIVRGMSGSGKTTFALNTLVRFPGRRVYVTCRVERHRLRAYFPWVDDPQYRIDIVDIDPRESSSANLRALTDQWRWPHDNISEDGVLQRWKWLPAPLHALWQSLNPDTPTMVVIDSWDGFVDSFVGVPGPRGPADPSSRRDEIERLLLRSISFLNAHLMLVVERSQPTATDYLVDGIVDLETRVTDGRAERWARIRKLRGVQIEDPEYPFTLDGGDFDIVGPLTEGATTALFGSEPDPSPMKGYLWPGSLDFAEAFGRLPIGHMSLVEVDQGVSSTGLKLVLIPIVDAVLRAGGRVVLSIPPTMGPTEFWSVLREHFTPDDLVRKFRIIASGPGTAVSEEMQGTVLHLPADHAPKSPLYNDVRGFLSQPNGSADDGHGAFHWHTGFRLLVESAGMEYTEDSAPGVAQQALADAPLHLMILGQNGDRVFQSLGEMSTIYLRFQDRAGRIFLNGVRPRTQSYALGDGFGRAPYRLLRVV